MIEEYGSLSFGDVTFNSPGEGISLVINLELASVVEIVAFDSETLARGMQRLDSVYSMTTGNGSPSLVTSVGLVPLYNLGSRLFLLLSDVDALPVQDTLEHVSSSMGINPSPPLVEAFILFIGDESFAVVERSSRDVNCLT